MSQVPSRVSAQRLLFAPPALQVPLGLYAQPLHGRFVPSREAVTVDRDSALTTNTFFGRFPASWWQRWTGVCGVRMELSCTGSGELRLMASDDEGKARQVDGVFVAAEEPESVVLGAELDRFVDGGALWLDVVTSTRSMRICSAAWTVAAPRRITPVAVVMPTFNRVGECLAILESLAADPAVLDRVATVHVIDQGEDPIESRKEFEVLARSLAGRLRYVRQSNLGGSGGFSRGLYEITERFPDGAVHPLFLDDDIWLEPETVLRLAAFADHTRQPVIVGGQMLRMLHPDRLLAGAEDLDLDALLPGRTVDGALTGSVVATAPGPAAPQQDRRVDAGYNGWWSCLIPTEVVRDVGYPLPLFLQWDDVEYAVRARHHDYPTVTLPGAAVWHVDFDWKDRDIPARYFHYRNALITAALHGRFDRWRTTMIMAERFAGYLVGMQYGLAEALLRAVGDFVSGPGRLDDGGAGAAADLARLRAASPEARLYPASAVPVSGSAPALPTTDMPTPNRRMLVFAGRLLRQLAGRVHGTASVTARQTLDWWHISRFDTVVVTDFSRQGVHLRRLDRDLLRSLVAQGLTVFARLAGRGCRAASAWRTALPELSSRERWERFYHRERHR